MVKILREYVKLLVEGPKSVSDALLLKLGMIIDDDNNIVLFSTDVLQKVKIDESATSEAVEQGLIFGYMNAGWQAKCEAMEVALVAAEKGFGPLLYDTLMALSPNKFIMPDRIAVSSSARNIWRKYANDRPDVEIRPLPGGCKTRHSNPEPELANRYGNGTVPQYQALVSLASKVIQGVAKVQSVNEGQVKSFILSCANEFYVRRRHEED